jgi:hypothetical protein
MQLYVLVDYDNVHEADRRVGLAHVITKIARLVDANIITDDVDRLAFRLYGGWFQEASLSRSAQRLTGELQAAFPTSAMLAGKARILQVEFARALLADPRNNLTHTYRAHGQAPRLSCQNAPYIRCTASHACPIRGVADFINLERCSQSGCAVTPTGILKKEEQKLVDSMLISDIAYLSYRAHEKAIVVVSADDDIWPGVVSALVVGTGIQRVFPKPNYGVRNRYAIPGTANYQQVTF